MTTEERERQFTRMLDEEGRRSFCLADLFPHLFAADSEPRVRGPRSTPTDEQRARGFADWLDTE